MTEVLGSSQDSQIDFEVTTPISGDKAGAPYLNIFVGRSFPIEAHQVMVREPEGTSDVVSINMNTIKERLTATEDTDCLDALDEFRRQQFTGFLFPLAMGQFVDHETRLPINVKDIDTN